MKIARRFHSEIVAHALSRPHTEVCGLVACKDDEVQAVYPCINQDDNEHGWGGASFTIPPEQQMLLLETIERDGHYLGAIYHSHPGMDAVPSSIDVGYAEGWPGVLWIIVSLPSKWRRRKHAEVWTWRIEDRQITTAELAVIEDGTPQTEGRLMEKPAELTKKVVQDMESLPPKKRWSDAYQMLKADGCTCTGPNKPYFEPGPEGMVTWHEEACPVAA